MVREFLEDLRARKYSTATVKTYATNLQEFVNWARANRQNPTWASLTNTDIQEYLNDMSAPTEQGTQQMFGLATNTVLARRTCLSSLFAYMMRKGMRTDNPARNVATPRKETKVRQPLPSEVIDATVYDARTDIKVRSLIAIMSETGMRISEALALNTADIEKNEMRVKVHGKGRKERYVYYGHRTQTTMNAWLRHKGQVFIGRNEREWRYEIYMALRRNGATDEMSTPHNIRHYFATKALNNRMTIEVLSNLMGHEQVTTTQTYARFNQDTIMSNYKAAALG